MAEKYESMSLLNMTNNITTETLNSKKIYFDNLTKKLSDPKSNQKAYWGILKSSNSIQIQLFLLYS